MKIYIYSNVKILCKIQYLFTYVNFTPIYIHNLLQVPKNEYILIFNKIYNPKKKFLNEIIKIIKEDKGFTYLSKDKEIYITNNTNIIDGIVYIKKKNNYKILFDEKSNKHEHIIIRMNDYNQEYLYLLKNYMISYSSILDKDYSFEAYKILHSDEVKTAYCIVYTINDIMDLTKVNNINYKNHRIVIVPKNLDCYDMKVLKIHCYKNNYILLDKITSLRYLWFERIVFINNKTPLSEDVFKKLDELHESFEVVNLTKLISVTAKTLVYYEIDNINIKNSKITYPSNDNDFELLYNKIVENKLLQCKGYDIIYDCIEKMSYKNQQTMSKLLSMAVLCKRNVLSQSIININKEDYKILFDWFLLFKSANKQITTDGSEIDYTPLMKKIGCDFLQHVVDKDIYMNDKNIINSIVNVYDVFIKIIDTNVYNALISVTKYLSKYITYAQTKSMIQMLLPHVSRAPDIKSFISLVEIIYPDFTIEKLLELYPNDSGAVELFISLTCNFSATDNLKTNVFDKRFKIKQNLELLLANNNITTQGLDTIISLNTGNFFMSYHGVSSKDIFILKCKLIRKICPELNYSINTEFKNKKIQVCFISSFLTRQHSVYKDRHQVIKQMADNPLFDVYFLTIDELRHDIKPSFGNAKHLQINRNLVEAKTLLNSMKLDAIVYCEIGMDPFFYLLAFMKLAKIQINTWGHSDTSGIDTIDYFFSSKYYEQEYNDAQNNYSEKLILLNSLCTYYINPVTKYPNLPFKSRYYYGFNDNSVIYFCGQSLFKFNQTYYQYIINIMNNNDRAVLLMLNGDNKIDFIKNINHDIINRIHWFNGMSHPDYLNLMNISNVVLDTYPFGGCNSSLEAFALGKVVVTQPSPMINGRFTKGFYDKMKLSHYVTNSMEEYIEFARKLIDSNYREMIENEIKNNRDVLFNDIETVEDWTHKIIELLN